MQPESDAQLLAGYAERGDERAFTEIVARHANLVYSAALRQVNLPDIAAEVAQQVFIGLARGAQDLSRRLAPDAALAGWLCRSARNLSLNLRRDEFRRHSRERQAMEHPAPTPETAPDWEHLRPVLDEAMSDLSEPDYDALVMRFFKNQDLRSVGLALGLSDDAAQKRVSRAVERLREFLAKRGVTVGAHGLGVVITANAIQAAPVGLALTISTTATLAGTTLATTATATAIKTIAMTTLQKTLITAAIVAAVGAGIYEARQALALRTQVQNLQQQQAPLADQIQQLQTERDAAADRLSALTDELERAKGNFSELLKLRAEVTRLRKEADASANESKSAKDFQSGVLQVFSNTPPIRTFVSTTTTFAAWNQAIVTGGWKTPSGKRAIVLVTLQPREDSKQLTINSKIVEYTEEAGEKLGLAQFNFDERKSDGTPVRAKAHTMTSEQSEAILKAAKDSEGTEIAAVPSVSTISGRQAQIQTVDIHQTPSGEIYTTGPILDFIPTISPDGQSVQMQITTRLDYLIQLPRN